MTAHAVNFLLTLAAIGAILATMALFIEASACLVRRERPFPLAPGRPATAVLVPAHNEERGIEALIGDIRPQLPPGDRLIVVADNCSDNTAEFAARGGAEVVVREDTSRCGKGFALAAGLRHLVDAPPEVVIFIDADCRLSPGGVEALSRACAASGTPVQCLNLMVAGTAKIAQSGLAEFAWRIKNDLRPTGYAHLGLPCQLLGTGMALPWRLIDPQTFATGHVTEDLMIGLECAMNGLAPRFFRGANVVSTFPETQSGRDQQKKRWMHGHLALIGSHAPRLLWHGLRRGDLGLLALAADLLVPPLGLLAVGHTLVLSASAAWAALSGSAGPLVLASFGSGMFAFSLTVGWHLYGRNLIGSREMTALPGHLFRIVRFSASFARGKRSLWVRADRSR